MQSKTQEDAVEAQNSKKSFVINVLFYLLIGLIVIATLKFILPLVSPFIMGFLIAYLLRKPTKSLVASFKLPYKPVSALVVLVFMFQLDFLFHS